MIIITDTECEAVQGSGISERVIFPEQRPTLEIMYAAMVRLEGAELHYEELRRKDLNADREANALLTANIEQERDVLRAENERLKENVSMFARTTAQGIQENESLRERCDTIESALRAENEKLKNEIYEWLDDVIDFALQIEQLREQLRTSRAEERKRCVEIADQWAVARIEEKEKYVMSLYSSRIRALGDAEPQKPRYPIGGYAPGDYFCLCFRCKKQFQGDKRAVECEPCARDQCEPQTPKTPKTYDAYDISVLVAAATSGNIGAIELAAQLIGQQPCGCCGFVVHHCRCEHSKP
jgi:hypothetical protein